MYRRKLAPSRRTQLGYLGIGVRRALGSDPDPIGTFLNSYTFYAPLTTTVVPNRGTGSATFTRATTATVTDFEGLVKPILSGEVRFQGARRVRNHATNSGTLTAGAGWTVNNATSVVGAIAPDGTATAYTFTATAANGQLYRTTGLVTADGGETNSIWARRVSGSGTIGLILDGSASNQVITLTSSWQRFSATRVTLGGNGFIGIQVNTSGDVIEIVWPQSEKVGGQANQNPSEYVSVGVLSSPFHGAMVDGVKYFATENGNTVASNVVTEAAGAAIGLTKNQSAYLPGVAGSYFSTPDAAPIDITGSYDIDACVAFADWTPGAYQFIAAKDNTAKRTLALALKDTNNLYCEAWDSAGGGGAFSSSVLPTSRVADGCRLWVRAKVTWALTGTCTCDFYTSEDGVTWTVLGVQQSFPATGNPLGNFDNQFWVGDRQIAAAPMVGKVYRVRLYNGLRDSGGTLAVDFNPQDWTSGSTFASAQTGETWTINGNAKINNFPLFGYLSEQASTNYALRSQEFDNASWALTNVTVSANAAVAPDGTATADKLVETAVNGLHLASQSGLGVGTATYTWSVYAKAGERSWIYIDAYSAIGGSAFVFFDLTNGVIGTTAGGVTAQITAVGNGIYRCSVVRTTNGNPSLAVGLASADNTSSYAGDITKGAYVWGYQLEALTFPTSYIPTTTASVTRNADVLTYPTSGNQSSAAGAAYAEFSYLALVVPPGAYPIVLGEPGGNRMLWINVGDAPVLARIWDGTTTVASGNGNSAQGVPRKAMSTWGGSSLSVAYSGATIGTGSFDGSMNAGASFNVGEAGTAFFNGTIRNVKLWTSAASDAALTRATA